MKRFSLFFAACSFTLAAFAHEISADQSLGKAVATISKRTYAKQVRGKADFALVHTQKCEQNGKALYYVFRNEQNGGFVITGADHRANSVLGYTENGTFEQALTIPAFRSWLSGCEAAMQWLSDNEESGGPLQTSDIPDQVVTNADHTISMTIPGRRFTEDATLPASVEPLLGGIVWNQDEPFNRLCPELVFDGDTIQCPTGCVATATAQVMKYWEWPKQGTGSCNYTMERFPIELEADFSQSVYDWDNMLDDYSGDYTDEQAYAVAKLMSDVGIALLMEYGPSTSSAYHDDTAYALTHFFGYNKGMQVCDRIYFTYAEWNNLVKNELAQSRPIIMGGGNYYQNNGHEYVLDGYNEDGYYHVNWGWGGSCNGYFDINYLNPFDQGIGDPIAGYNCNQEININCFPDTDGTSEAHFQMIMKYEPRVLTDELDDVLVCIVTNLGYAPYDGGQGGFIAMIDNEIIGSAIMDTEELEFLEDQFLHVKFTDLGITSEMLGDKKCKIYPVMREGDGFKVPLSLVAFQNYILVGLDADGNFSFEQKPEDNASPICKHIEITRDYAGFNIKAKAVVANEEGRPTFDRPIYMYVRDADSTLVAIGQNFAFINAGDSCELEFNCKLRKQLEIGKTYEAFLLYKLSLEEITIPGSETTVTMQDPGAEPDLTYADFALDKTAILPGETLTVSFNIENTGGFGTETYYAYLFADGVSMSLTNFPEVDLDLPTGITTCTSTARINYEEGSYHVDVYTLTDDGDWNRITTESLAFTIKNPVTAISSITDNADANAPYYDLQGRRVANPTKGIFICNGQKVVK